MAEELLFIPLLTQQAPSKSREILEQARRHFGFVPNLLASMAPSPANRSVYFHANVGFEFGTLTLAERQIVLLTASKENKLQCFSLRTRSIFVNVPGNALLAIKSGQNPQDLKLNALVSLTRELVAQRGCVSRELIQAFLDAGYKRDQLLEVLIGIGRMTISNYFDRMSAQEIDGRVPIDDVLPWDDGLISLLCVSFRYWASRTEVRLTAKRNAKCGL